MSPHRNLPLMAGIVCRYKVYTATSLGHDEKDNNANAHIYRQQQRFLQRLFVVKEPACLCPLRLLSSR